jgi:outer membrane receptor protein involved in Fe transport
VPRRLLTFVFSIASPAWAHDDIEEITVEGERETDTATERSLDRARIETFPAQSADELLRAMPGLHLSAHGGTGKAFQFLLRGFDAEHGADLAVYVEGVPMNEPSNVHGHGYLDLHFLPTALVEGLHLVKGSYRAEDGDFAITGSAAYNVGKATEGLLMSTSVGSDRSGKGTVAWRPAGAREGTFLLAEGEGAAGVGEGRRYHQLRAAGGLESRGAVADARLMLFAYDGAFESPGVLREDDLLEGSIGFYDRYPEAGDGASRRLLTIGTLSHQENDTSVHAVGWAGVRDLRLDQNFTGSFQDEEHGDATRQAERATDGGARLRMDQVAYVLHQAWAFRAGLDLRLGSVDQTEDAITPDGEEWEPRLDATVRTMDAAGWAEGRLTLGPRVRVVPGIRLDRIQLATWNELTDPDPDWARSGATVLSPKGTAVAHVLDPLDLFVAAGRGFRTPDGRGIAEGDLAPITRSDSAEAGFGLSLAEGWSLHATGFGIWIGNELVFDHPSGRFLSEGRTRRLGVEAVADATVLPWLRMQLDASYVDGRFVASGTPIPYAPRLLTALGAFVEQAHVGPGHLSGGVRAWYLGPRPLPSGFASHPALVGSLTSTWSVGHARVGLEVDNLFLGRWRDGEFVYSSWFDTSEPRSELPVLHVTAGDPFAIRLVLGAEL